MNGSIQKYISLMKLTHIGLKDLGKSQQRQRKSEDRVSALGGRSLAFYAAMGSYDFIQIFEMPNNESMLLYVMSARQDGYIDPLILPIFDSEVWNGITENITKISIK